MSLSPHTLALCEPMWARTGAHGSESMAVALTGEREGVPYRVLRSADATSFVGVVAVVAVAGVVPGAVSGSAERIPRVVAKEGIDRAFGLATDFHAQVVDGVDGAQRDGGGESMVHDERLCRGEGEENRLMDLFGAWRRRAALAVDEAGRLRVAGPAKRALAHGGRRTHLFMPTVGAELPLLAALASLRFGIRAGRSPFFWPSDVPRAGHEVARWRGCGNSTDAAMAMVGNMRLSTPWCAAALGPPFLPNLSRRVTVRYHAPP